jgi:single-strand DNA-binding protein
MASLCKVTIVGNLGRDPEMRFTQTGRPMTKFSVAVNNRRKMPDGEFKDETDWFDVTAWGQLAERASEQLSKGKLVLVEGRFQTRSWVGQDGQTRKNLEVQANDILILERRPTAPTDEQGSERMDELEPDEIPF